MLTTRLQRITRSPAAQLTIRAIYTHTSLTIVLHNAKLGKAVMALTSKRWKGSGQNGICPTIVFSLLNMSASSQPIAHPRQGKAKRLALEPGVSGIPPSAGRARQIRLGEPGHVETQIKYKPQFLV